MAFALSLCLCVVLRFVCGVSRSVALRLDRLEMLVLACEHQVEDSMRAARPLNAHANMLGQVVEARKYEASDWETYVVCAVSWHGSLCLRRIDAPDRSGFWIHHDRVPERVREVAP